MYFGNCIFLKMLKNVMQLAGPIMNINRRLHNFPIEDDSNGYTHQQATSTNADMPYTRLVVSLFSFFSSAI